MPKTEDIIISEEEIEELKNLALMNKQYLMYKRVRIVRDDVEYPFLIKGVGGKTIKLELYIDYESILKYKGNSLMETKLWDKINEK